MYHVPVLLNETLDGLNIRPDGTYVDVTFGGGGHSKAILERLGKTGRLIAFDQDEDAMKNIIDDKRFIFVRSNFRYLGNFLRYHHVEKIDGLLADLGVSSHHFDDDQRGFSFRFDGNLDMRMNAKAATTAADILNTYTEEQVSDVFYFYGELRQARQIAKGIVRKRAEKPFAIISDLTETTKSFFPTEREKKEMAKLFQALRIEVNHEMDALKQLLIQTVDFLDENGRLAILTYHSLEDRLVKNFIKSGNFEGKIEKDFFGHISAPLTAINNKVIVPNETEINRNPRSRSAKLRIAQKTK
ncbi:MAG: 16S rRNA (cytosine(1402)-N(4))-methyltransferase RsmH [Sphingobacteriia bacterium]|nr:16S rRNA (cytosine(1402)-N(4))-methyltransferase RsmH [Sphingobacteriia bacterium]